MARKTTRRSRNCPPCQKRKGSPRFSLTCRKEFKACMLGGLQAGQSFRTTGRDCMTALHQCKTKRSSSHLPVKYARTAKRKGYSVSTSGKRSKLFEHAF